MSDRFTGRLEFERYNFSELDKREKRFRVVCDGAAWIGFLRKIREHKGVLEAICAMLRQSRKRRTLSNQFTLLECWYNVARLYPVKGGLDRNEFCSPDEFVERLEQLAVNS